MWTWTLNVSACLVMEALLCVPLNSLGQGLFAFQLVLLEGEDGRFAACAECSTTHSLSPLSASAEMDELVPALQDLAVLSAPIKGFPVAYDSFQQRIFLLETSPAK